MIVCTFAMLTVVVRTTISTLSIPEYELQNRIFKDYNWNVRPVKNYSKPLIVAVGLELRKVLYLDELKQSFKSTINVNLYWQDEFLQWNGTEFHGIENIEIPFNKNIWIPDLMVYNALEKPENLGVKDAYIRLNNIGQIYVWTQTNFETSCEIKTKKYPYDVQVCEIIITRFMTSDEKIDIRPLENYVNLKNFVEIAEWKIENTLVKTTVDPINISVFVNSNISDLDVINYTSITYTMVLRRSCKLCFFNNIFPVMILAALNFLTFFVPCESGEKLSFPIAMFLTLAVFLTVITQSLPESIDGTSYLSSYVTFQLAVSAMILLCAVTSLQIHHKWRKSHLQNKRCLITGCVKRKQIQINGCKDHYASAEEHNVESEQSESVSECKDTVNLSFAFDKLMFKIFGLFEVIVTTSFIVLIWH